jgi:hypothetical protein
MRAGQGEVDEEANLRQDPQRGRQSQRQRCPRPGGQGPSVAGIQDDEPLETISLSVMLLEAMLWGFMWLRVMLADIISCL